MLNTNSTSATQSLNIANVLLSAKWQKVADADYGHVFTPDYFASGWGFFAADEVQEIWLTFSDPQMKNWRKRLSSTMFLNRYRRFLVDGGLIHLKTDSNFLFTYTTYLVEKNSLPVVFRTEDLYHRVMPDEKILSIQTYYESMWIERGLNIRYMKFQLPRCGELVEPDVEIPLDEYRSFKRDKRSGLETSK